MGRAPCCDKANVKKGPWSPEEDAKLKDYMDNYGTPGNWIALPHKAGLKRCGKSCRLRWLNYLRPNIKHGEFSDDEDRIICTLYANIGSRWSIIAAQLPGRTDNDIKNYWNTKLKKKILGGCHVITPPPYRSSKQHNFTDSFYSPPPPPLAPAVSPYSYFTEASTLSFMSCSSSEEETLIQSQTQMGNSNMQSFGSIYGVGAEESHVQNNQIWSTGGEEMINSNNNYPLLENNYYSQIEEIKNLISSCSSNNYVSSSSNNSRLGMSNFLFAENKGRSSSNLSDDGRSSSSACTATAPAINADCSLYNHKI